jgi:hypothetical protein
LLGHVSCDALASIGTSLLNKVMRTTRLVHNVGCSGYGVVSRIDCSIRYFRCPQSADCLKRFHRVPSPRYRSESSNTCDYSVELCPCRDVTCAPPMLLNGLTSIHDIFVNIGSC